MSAPVLSWLFHALEKGLLHSNSLQATVGRGPPEGSPQLTVVLSSIGLLSPTLRANPYPEVTDLFCRLPLSTLFYRLEAAHLGDLRRLWVRPGVRTSHSTRFSRAVESAPDNTKAVLLSHPINLIADQFDSKVYRDVKKKRKLFPGLSPASLVSFVLPLNIHVLV